MKAPQPRWRLFAKPDIQVPLIFRIAIYWLSCQALIAITIVGFQYLAGGTPAEGDRQPQLLVPALIVSSIALPIALVDVIGLTNRYLSSIRRFESQLAELASDVDQKELEFKSDDPCREMYVHVNRTLAQLHARQSQDTGVLPASDPAEIA